MLKKISLILIMALLSGVIIASQLLINQKADTSKIPKDQRVAALVKPSVVRVIQGYSISWVYQPPMDSDYQVDAVIQEYLASINGVTDYYTSGSGAIINSNGYIITNAHVVNVLKTEDAQLVDDAILLMADELSSVFQTDLETMYYYLIETLYPDRMVKVLKVVLPSGQVVDGEVKSYGAPTGEGKDISVIKIEKKNLPSIRLGDSDKLNLQDDITIFGYPGAADSSMFSEDSSLVVSITNGKVSAVDKKSIEGAPVLQVDAAATHGNSGGPITDETGNVVGLLTFRSEQNPGEVQGFNFAVPVSTVKEFVNQAGADNDEATLDKLYREGLDLYWGGYYIEALENFEAVQRIYPEHSDIKRFITDSQKKIPESKMLWSKYSNTALIVDITCGVLILLLFIILIVDISKNSKKVNVQQLQAPPLQPDVVSYGNNQNPWSQKNPPMNSISQDPSQKQHHIVVGKLYEISGPHKNSSMALGSEPVVIGRDPRLCKIIFPAEFLDIGRVHCQLSFDLEGQVFILKDLSSITGTFLSNGEKINPKEEMLLKSGESFYLCSKDISFEVWIE